MLCFWTGGSVTKDAADAVKEIPAAASSSGLLENSCATCFTHCSTRSPAQYVGLVLFLSRTSSLFTRTSPLFLEPLWGNQEKATSAKCALFNIVGTSYWDFMLQIVQLFKSIIWWREPATRWCYDASQFLSWWDISCGWDHWVNPPEQQQQPWVNHRWKPCSTHFSSSKETKPTTIASLQVKQLSEWEKTSNKFREDKIGGD